MKTLKMAKKRRYERYIFLILFFVFLILFIFILFLIPKESKSFDITLNVGEKIGVEINNSALKFGTVIPGSESVKKVFIDNNHDYPIKAKIKYDGSVSPFLNVEPSIEINAGQNYTLPIIMIVPLNASYGNYSGKLKIYFFKL